MDYLPLSDNAARQAIDACTVFEEHARVLQESRRFEGGMYWKRQDAYEYLVRTGRDNRQHRIGPRDAETEQVYADFTQGKQAVQSRLRSLTAALQEAERMNKAVKAGRVPSTVIAVLRALDDAGLGAHFTVVGTHALYAYEAAAGVRIVQGALATQDVDLLWDARKRVRFLTALQKTQTSMLGVLQRADKSFRRKEGQNETAINDKGFEVDFLRRMAEGDDPHPFRFSDDEGDLWPVQARRANRLAQAPVFEQIIVGANGKMARMRTVAPADFIAFKRWLATEAPQRPPIKRRRDQRQAEIVQGLIDEGLLIFEQNALQRLSVKRK